MQDPVHQHEAFIHIVERVEQIINRQFISPFVYGLLRRFFLVLPLVGLIIHPSRVFNGYICNHTCRTGTLGGIPFKDLRVSPLLAPSSVRDILDKSSRRSIIFYLSELEIVSAERQFGENICLMYQTLRLARADIHTEFDRYEIEFAGDADVLV